MDSEKKDKKDKKKNERPIQFSEMEEFMEGLDNDDNNGIEFIEKTQKVDNSGIEFLDGTQKNTREKIKKTIKTTFNVSQDEYDKLQNLSKALNTTNTKVVKQALHILEVLLKLQPDPSVNSIELMVKDKDGKEEKIIFTF